MTYFALLEGLMDIDILINLIHEELEEQRKRHRNDPDFQVNFESAFNSAGHQVFLPDNCYRKSWVNAIRRKMVQEGLLPKQKKEEKKYQTASSGRTWHDRYDHY